LHQFQLLSRPLQVPPSASAAGKPINARYKPKSGRYEIYVPNDVRPEVWDSAKGRDLGAARYEEDREDAALHDVKFKEKDPREMRLNETRLLSERVPHAGAYVLGIVRDGKLHLHPISETHQFSPNLSYLDVLSKNSSPRHPNASDEDEEGPPPDPDDPQPAPSSPKKVKKAGTSNAKEVTVAARRVGDGSEDLGGLSSVRRELILKRRKERDEPWQALDYHDEQSQQAGEAYEKLFSLQGETLSCTTPTDAVLKATYQT